jgi:hypothetical protein
MMSFLVIVTVLLGFATALFKLTVAVVVGLLTVAAAAISLYIAIRKLRKNKTTP